MDAGIARQAEMIAAGEISSRELTEAYLERIARIEPRVNAFRVVLGERAREAADAADARVAAGETAPLLGVPVAAKDNIDVAGELTTHGTLGFTEVAREDCEQVRRMREAGAVLIGKTNLPELAVCGFTETEAWGITRNPWDLGHSTGGSSGGSAAAVAAGMVGAASASDGAGSIRIPAANCGLFGLKPQRGRISLLPDREHWFGLSVAGCVSRRVIDTALWLDVAAGRASGDADTPPPPETSFVEAARRSPGKLRIAMSMKPVRAAAPPILDDRVVKAIEATAGALRSLGHEVSERAPGYGGLGNDFVPRYLAGVAQDVAARPLPRAARAAHPGLCPARPRDPRQGPTQRARKRAQAQRSDQRDLRRRRRPAHARHRRAAGRGGAVGRQGCAEDAGRDGSHLPVHAGLELHRTARRLRPGSGREGRAADRRDADRRPEPGGPVALALGPARGRARLARPDPGDRPLKP